MTEVNDAQSRLNPTYVKSILTPRSEEEVRKAILTAAESGDSISMAGGRHSMGGNSSGPEPCILIFVGWIGSLNSIVGTV
jgi:FAD/FMN-containing dehydrogenase